MEALKGIRADFVQKIGLPGIKGLLDDLWQQKVLSTEDKDSVLEDQTSKTDRARCLIDMVIGKGERASQIMIKSMKDRDHGLCNTLGLISSPDARVEGSPTEEGLGAGGRSANLIRSPDQFRTERLKDKDDVYPVTALAARTRMALLITNVRFDHLNHRDGAEKDEGDMENLLKDLGYNVVKHRDLSGKDMDQAVERFCKDPCLAATDSVFVVIMSHGLKGIILGVHHLSDSEPDVFPIDHIYKHLDPACCPALLNKPKVVIIQACRGGTGGSVQVEDGPGSVPKQAPGMQVDSALPPQLADSVDEGIEEDAFRIVHKEKDLISLLSCTADTVSYRHPQKGSFFIKYIVEIFKTHAHEDHVEELFRRVMKRFEDEGPSVNLKQMAVKDRCTLTRKLYLFPRH